MHRSAAGAATVRLRPPPGMRLRSLSTRPRGAESPEALRRQVQRQRGQERALASSAARLGRLERQAARAVAVLTQREAAAQHDLDAWEARLADTQARLRAQRRRLVRLRARVA